jgi:hypothetical protein
MITLINDPRRLAALAALVAVASAAISYVIWRNADRSNYAVDTVKYLKAVSVSPQTIDATVRSAPHLTSPSSIMEPAASEHAGSPVDQQNPSRSAISWNTPKPVFELPEIRTSPDLKNLTGLYKLPSLAGPAPGTFFSSPALSSEPSSTTFRLIVPGAAPTGASDMPAGLTGSLPGGAAGTAGGLLRKR